MPPKDLYHDTVKRALERDGWKITRENQMLVIGEARVFIDLSAELIVAERDKIKIAVEVKSFLAPSLISGFQDALGQYRLYSVQILPKATRPRKTFGVGCTNSCGAISDHPTWFRHSRG